MNNRSLSIFLFGSIVVRRCHLGRRRRKHRHSHFIPLLAVAAATMIVAVSFDSESNVSKTKIYLAKMKRKSINFVTGVN